MVGIDLKEVQVRRGNQNDMAYIYDTWMEDFLSQHHIKLRGGKMETKQVYVAMMRKELYYKEMRKTIEKIIYKSEIRVACNADDENQIFGYAVYRTLGVEIGILSWLYVKPVYRGLGLCNLLMQSIGTMDVVTNVTPQRRWFPKKYSLIYNPFMEGYDD